MKTNLNAKKIALLTAAGALVYSAPAIADHEKSITKSDASADTEMSFEYGHDGLEMNEPAGAAVSSQSYSLESNSDADAVADKILRMYQRGRQHAFWLDRQLQEKGPEALVEETYHQETGTLRAGDRDSEALISTEIKDPSGVDADVDADFDADVDMPDVDVDAEIHDPAGAQLDVDSKSNLDVDSGGVSTDYDRDLDVDANIESNIDHDSDVNIDRDSTSFDSNVDVNDRTSGVAIEEPSGASLDSNTDVEVDANIGSDVTESATPLDPDQNSTSFSGDSQFELNQDTSVESSTSFDSNGANLELRDPAGAQSEASSLDQSLDSPNPSVAPRNDGGVTERSTAAEINASAAENDSYSPGSEINEPSGADNSIQDEAGDSSSSDSGLLQDRSSDFQSNNSTDGSISEPSGAEAESSTSLDSSSQAEEDKYHP